MAPVTHLLASWIIAAKTTDNRRDCRLVAWPIRLFSAALFFWSLWLAIPRGYSFVGVFNRRLDTVFVGILRQWHERWLKPSSQASGGGKIQ